MFGFTRKTDYALVALACLAEEQEGTHPPQRAPERAEAPSRMLSARAISERYRVPLPLLMNVLKNLVGQGLVRSTRGARGGYTLARPPAGISVRDVIAAIEGPVSVTVCCDEEEDPRCQECHVEIRCPITSSVRRLNERINNYLGEITLADLLNPQRETIGPIFPPETEDGIHPGAEEK